MKLRTTAKYDRLRKTLESIYTYGTESRKRVWETGLMNVNTYDKTIGELYALFRDGLIQERYREGEKFPGVKKSYFEDPSLTLAELFSLNSPNPAALLTAALAFTMRDDAGKTAAALNRRAERTAEGALPSEATLRREVKALQEMGLFPEKKRDCPARTAPLDALPEDVLRRLYYLAVFFGSAGFPRAEGAFLARTLRRALDLKGAGALPEAFLYRGNAVRSIFDEELVCLFLAACEEGRVVKAKRGGAVRRYEPAFLRPDTRLGRWYLFCLCDGSPAVVRLANLSEAEVTAERYDCEAVRRQVETAFSESYISSRREGGETVVEAELCFGGRDGSRREFERELLFGRIGTEADGRELWRASVSDPGELRPFLRAYGDAVRVLPSETHRLDRELREEWERMLKRYGAADGSL